jgi:outer membrane protein assembly factor BamB
VDADAVFFGSYDHALYAVSLDTGKELWRYKTGNAVASSPLVTRQFFIGGGPSPRVRSLFVTVGSIDGGIYILDMQGRPKAVFETEAPVFSSAAGPVAESLDSLGDNSTKPAIIAAGSQDGRMYGIDVNTGREIWRFKTGGPIDSSPAVGAGAFFFGGGDGSFYAVDAGNGDRRWRFEVGRAIRSSPAVFDNYVLFGCSDGNLYAVDINRGRLRWKYRSAGPVESSPSVVDGVVYFGSDDGAVHALDCDTGALMWKFQTPAPVRSSPTISDGVVYFGSNDGFLYAVS